MSRQMYEYENFKAHTPKVDDGWYLVKNGITYKVDIPIDKMRFTKSVNILTGEVYYPTNADRIRAMSDDELANFLDRVEMGDIDYSKTFCDLCDGFYDCHEDCLVGWLKAEATI